MRTLTSALLSSILFLSLLSCSSTRKPAEADDLPEPPAKEEQTRTEPPKPRETKIKKEALARLDVQAEVVAADEVEFFAVPTETAVRQRKAQSFRLMAVDGANFGNVPPDLDRERVVHNTEEYNKIDDNTFLAVATNPLSTFSIDVDAASYANLRRFLNSSQMPYKDAVRIEEMVNYFTYDYKDPSGDHPFSINTEISQAPWNAKHRLVHIGLQGKKLDYKDLKSSNLVFLVDASGSMRSQNKLLLLKKAFKLLLNNLSDDDRVAIVAYAGAAGLVLPSTKAKRKTAILAALDKLEAGGSTAGGAGIQLAYKVAKENFMADGNNRVILATDGDFNVGVSSTSELVRTIEEKRGDGIYLTICGFGMGNYKDGRMESLSNAGNGNYFYIDSIVEAEKVFVTEMRATLFTIAKDVKIQVEFNPAVVQAYRLIGYENRMLKSEDFNDDKKDAGELGAGHTVTALYEIIPVGVESEFIRGVDELKYQKQPTAGRTATDEMMTVKLRYKRPKEETSRLTTHILKNQSEKLAQTSDNFRFSAAVAQFGMLLRDSEFKGDSNYSEVLDLAQQSKGSDEHGYRAEFIQLVKKAALLSGLSKRSRPLSGRML